MSFSHLLKYGMSLPPHIALAKATELAKRRLLGRLRASRGRNQTTFVSATPVEISDISTLCNENIFHLLSNAPDGLQVFADKAMAHEFNLLGSGWTNVNRQPHAAPNPLSKGNQEPAQHIRSLISADYQAINWHSDFKSKFQWRADERSEAITYGHEPNVDIKVPWELARMQHLVQMALVSGFSKTNNNTEADTYSREFCDQSLDFISSNPPGYGVNWACTMDVALRAANLILAFDLFRTNGTTFTQDFVAEFVASIDAHGNHIVANLEWRSGFSGNHYLADIIGLLMISTWLPQNEKTQSWLAFAVHEFINEIGIQFHADGSNAEASTNYHRLSAEMAVYGSAVILGLPAGKRLTLENPDTSHWPTAPRTKARAFNWDKSNGPFSPKHFERIHKMAAFTRDVSKPDGHVAQIGDTDNGRLFKILPALLENTTDEDILDHTHLLAAIGGLLDDASWIAQAEEGYQFEARLVQTLKRGHKIFVPPKATEAISPAAQALPTSPATSAMRIKIALPAKEILSGIEAISYPDFGLYIWRSERLFLAIRCGAIGQDGNGGHAHNDQLSIELQIDGVDWLADPGTGVYTPDTKMRDAYRSHLAHFGPRIRAPEPSRLDLGLFRLEDNARAECLLFNETEFIGAHYGYETPIFRQIRITRSEIQITDTEGGAKNIDQKAPTTNVNNAQDLRTLFGAGVPFSRSYGLPKAP